MTYALLFTLATTALADDLDRVSGLESELDSARIEVDEQILDYGRGRSVATVVRGEVDACIRNGHFVIADGSIQLLPVKGEEGEWSSTTLQPDVFPFDMDRVSYFLANVTAEGFGLGGLGFNPQPGLKHGAAVYITDSPEPPNDVEPVAMIEGISAEIDPSVPEEDMYEVVWELDETIRVNEGEYIHVAVQHMGTFPHVMGLMLCEHPTTPTLESYWSMSVSQPFNWKPLSLWQIHHTPYVQVDGYTVLSY